MEDPGHLNSDVEGTSEDQNLQEAYNSQALLPSQSKRRWLTLRKQKIMTLKKVQRSEDHIEVLELDEVAHTANPNPRRSTRNRSRKLIINEDKKNEEEGNEAQKKKKQGE